MRSSPHGRGLRVQWSLRSLPTTVVHWACGWFGVLLQEMVLLTSMALPFPQNKFFLFNSLQDHVPVERRKRHGTPHVWDPAMIFPLRLSITLSPYASIAAPLFLHLLRDGETGYWLSLQPRYGGCSVWYPAPLFCFIFNDPPVCYSTGNPVGKNFSLLCTASMQAVVSAPLQPCIPHFFLDVLRV